MPLRLGSLRVALPLLIAVSLGVHLGGCAPPAKEGDAPAAAPEIVATDRLKGAYELSEPTDDPRAIATISFDGSSRYLLWRNVGCAGESTLDCSDTNPELGTYTLTTDTITLRDDASGREETMPLALPPPPPSTGLLTPKELIGGSNRLVQRTAKLAEREYGLVDTRNLPSFAAMWGAYPHGDPEEVKRLIGGRVDAAWIENTCVIRLSRALNSAGFIIPAGPSESRAGLHTVTGGDGLNYAYRVTEMRTYLNTRIGAPTITQTGNEIDPSAFDGKQGIIVFTVGFSNASGHFDLWNGSETAHDEYFSDATKVEFWPAPP